MSFRAILVAIVATARLLGTAVVSATPVVDDTQAFAGDATWYLPEGWVGTCGTLVQNTDLIITLGPDQYATAGANCLCCISVNYQEILVEATVMDHCESYTSDSTGLTSGTFQQLTSLDAGCIKITWDFK